MKKQFLFILLLTVSFIGYSQKLNNQIEINPFVRWDNYPGFSYHYAGRASKDYLKMKGTSYGINISYKYSLKKHLFIKAGLGFFKYRFDKLDNTNSLFGKSQARLTGLNSGPIYILFSTDKYHYNNLIFSTGIEKQFDLNKGVKFITCFNLSAYYTFSQYYHLTFNPYDGNLNFNQKEAGFLGASTNITVGITKQVGRLQIGPSILLPIYDSWKKDPVFLEKNYDGGKHKWLNGIGVGIVCNISLHKKTKL